MEGKLMNYNQKEFYIQNKLEQQKKAQFKQRLILASIIGGILIFEAAKARSLFKRKRTAKNNTITVLHTASGNANENGNDNGNGKHNENDTGTANVNENEDEGQNDNDNEDIISYPLIEIINEHTANINI